MRTLTQKQENFCNAIVSGMTAKDAYYHAYDTKCSDQVAYNEATRILSKEHVQEHLKRLREPLENHARTAAISEREKIKSILWDRLNIAIANNDDAMIVKYTDQINKMNHEYISTNINLDGNTNNMADIDIDTLKKLSS